MQDGDRITDLEADVSERRRMADADGQVIGNLKHEGGRLREAMASSRACFDNHNDLDVWCSCGRDAVDDALKALADTATKEVSCS